ncbi:branched-chain amino acid ABC transporter permease, partial [archaeon]|nr:branched-chain amino acid ABC transporter permease [archaeon]NDB55216.1 branched-chain amino acid ABC transporter permease [archaeon]NDB79159.1 branched-chain amino acid ABC transporter permease [archaeon]
NIKGTNFALRYEILLALTVSLVMVGGLFLFLEKTKLGKALRSTADNKDLAEISGIDTLRMIRITWFIGGGLAGVSGIIFASTLPVIPFSGFLFLLPAFAVIVLGGVGSLKGSVYAAMIIAFTQVLSNSYLTSIERILLDTPYERTALVSYNTITPFIILIFVILFKPQGLYGDE